MKPLAGTCAWKLLLNMLWYCRSHIGALLRKVIWPMQPRCAKKANLSIGFKVYKLSHPRHRSTTWFCNILRHLVCNVGPGRARQCSCWQHDLPFATGTRKCGSDALRTAGLMRVRVALGLLSLRPFPRFALLDCRVLVCCT